MIQDTSAEATRQAVREFYGQRITEGASCCGDTTAAPAAAPGYRQADVDTIPLTAAPVSYGCANPVALAELRPGESVLDLGSGAGLDVLLSAQRVGPAGRVYGLDMTPEMLERARANAVAAGATNVEFREGTLEDIPLADASVDVVISNCVINLSPDKGRALREAYRVLRPGGRFAVADMVRWAGDARAQEPGGDGWCACIDGALATAELEGLLRAAGFDGVTLELADPSDGGDVRSTLVRAAKPG